MSRYIDKKYFCTKCNTSWRGTIDHCPNCGSGEVYVETVTTTEFPELITKENVVEVKHGHWIVDREFGNDVMSGEQMVICSVCGKGIFWGKQNYCPNCGAKMDEVDNESSMYK